MKLLFSFSKTIPAALPRSERKGAACSQSFINNLQAKSYREAFLDLDTPSETEGKWWGKHVSTATVMPEEMLILLLPWACSEINSYHHYTKGNISIDNGHNQRKSRHRNSGSRVDHFLLLLDNLQSVGSSFERKLVQ